MASSSVIIRDLNFVRASIRPFEADPPSNVHADRVLALSVTREHFQSIAGRNAHVGQMLRRCKLTERAFSDGADLLPAFSGFARPISGSDSDDLPR
jgi:hypothetical protein